MIAVTYARWSSLEQSKGSTLERQMADCTKYCTDQGWTVIERLQDEGKSAYTGDNLKTGELGKFTQRFLQGHYAPDTVLVVEQLDRLSRMAPTDVMSWILQVVNAGLTIVTANDGLRISKDDLRTNQLGIISIVFNAFRAYSESFHKAERIGKAWRLKREARERGEEIAFTSIGPAWLTLDPVTRKWEEVEERVALVRRIFDEAERGDGRRTIAGRFNQEGIEPWGRKKSKGDGWHASYIQKILETPAVLGEYQPHTKARGDDRRTPIGEPIKGYFPQIISEAQFATIQARKLQQVKHVGAKGGFSNLLRGIAKCECGARMVYVKKASAGTTRARGKGAASTTLKADESYLVCDSYQRRRGCNIGHHINYPKLEAGILDALLPLALDDTYFARPDTVGKLVQAHAVAERDLLHKRTRADRAMELFMETGNPNAKAKWQEAQEQADAEAARVKELASDLIKAKGKVSPAEHLKRVQSVRSLVNDADEATRYDARCRVSTALREVVSVIAFDRHRQATAILVGGAHNIRFNDQGEETGSAGVLEMIRAGDDGYRHGTAGDDVLANAALDKVLVREKRANNAR
jgi:DNA invertase Pin-like site-specific DNA recombinase